MKIIKWFTVNFIVLSVGACWMLLLQKSLMLGLIMLFVVFGLMFRWCNK